MYDLKRSSSKILQHIIIAVSLWPHCAYFRMRKLKPQVAKVSIVASVMRDK